MERLDNQNRLSLALRVTRMFRNGVADKLHRRSLRRDTNNRVRGGAYDTVTHVLVRAVDGVDGCSGDAFRSLHLYD